MFYINTETNEYPVMEGFIKSLYPNTSFPEPFVAPAPFEFVYESFKPEFNSLTHFLKEGTPVQVDGKYQRTWSVESLNEETVAKNKEIEAARVKEDIISSTQGRLDAFAKTKNYDGILAACTYLNSTVPTFAAEAQYCIQARDITWNKTYEILAEIEAGTRPLPSGYQDIATELPVLEWPVAL